MKAKPIFFFSFANDQSETLRLQEEERQLREILQHAHDQQQIEFLSLGSTSLDDIYRTFNRFNNRIALFHYSGHSDESFLYLADKGARAENLSKVIGIQKKLALVFLNGCSNKQQVEDLFANGVKVVIATKAPIEDSKALTFSKNFYDALSGGKNIKESFDTAASRLKNEDPELVFNYREIVQREPIEGTELEWGLYAINAKYLDWVLPQAVQSLTDINYSEEVELHSPNVNKKLTLLAFEGLVNYHEDCKILWDEYQANPSPLKLNGLQKKLLESYPTALCFQLSDLFTSEARNKGRLRLRELNEAYMTVLKLINTICLADLWKAILDPDSFKPKEGFIIRPEYKKDLKAFFDLTANTSDKFDFGWLLATIRRIFNDNNKEPFIKESALLLDCFSNYDENYQAYRFMEQKVKNRLIAKNIDKSEVEDLCYETEKHLGVLLRTCAFLSVFQFVTIKDIGVNLPNRILEPNFIHKSAILKGYNHNASSEELPVSRKSFTNDNSVLVTKDFEQSDESLNLSPFLIDKNAFRLGKETLPKIYFFKGWGEDDTIHFELAETLREYFEIDKEIDENKFKPSLANIREQLLMFKADLGF